MAIFSQGDTVKVPFPYTDRATRQRRPALLVSATGLGEGDGLIWVMMITSAENRRWPGDLHLGASQAGAGLRVPSVIRPCKLATIEADHAEPLGRVRAELLVEVLAAMRAYLGL